MKNLFFLFVILTAYGVHAQNIDSLKTVLKNAKHDTTRCNILSELSNNAIEAEYEIFTNQLKDITENKLKSLSKESSLYNFYQRHYATALNNLGNVYNDKGEFEKAIEYVKRSLKIRENISDKLGIASSLNDIGMLNYNLGNISMALEYCQKSLEQKKIIGDKKSLAVSYNNVALLYDEQGLMEKALDYYYKGLKLREEVNDKSGIANILLNIGMIYKGQGDTTNAMANFDKGLSMYTEIGDRRGMANALNKKGLIYKMQGNIEEALNYYQKSLVIQQEIGNKLGISTSFNNIASVYFNKGNIPMALEYFHKSLKIREELGDKQSISTSMRNIGDMYMRQKKYPLALEYLNKSFALGKELGYPESIKNTSEALFRLHNAMGNYKEALDFYQIFIQMRDSIKNDEIQKSTVKLQYKYEYERHRAQDSVKTIEEKKVINAQFKQERTQRYALYGGLALVLLFAGFMFNRFKVTQKQKTIIERKEQQTNEQNFIIREQKHLIEERHKEITDSINYAERIQRSFMATKNILDANLTSTISETKGYASATDYFVFFKPKDIVSGDFYWSSFNKASESNGQRNLFYLATADSTGHGVPGAIMSLLNITSLEKAIEQGNIQPADILNHTRKTIINRLKDDGSKDGGKDGMDCSLCMYDFDKMKLSMSAANNPIWIVRTSFIEGEAREVIEIKPDKMPVGKHDKQNTSFTQREIELQKGDVVYTLTDGFPDQFGGENGKKFLTKNLRKLLVENAHLQMDEQKALLESTFTNWIGDLEQVDDVTIIGVKI